MSCYFTNVCGDGKFSNSVEKCDDGNNAPNDGCNELCVIEDGWFIEANVSIGTTQMREWCGDSKIKGAE